MPERTPESLAARLSVVETALADWQWGIGHSEDEEFTRAMLAAIEANSEVERRAAEYESDEFLSITATDPR